MNKQEAIEEIKNLEGLTILDKTINFNSKMIPKKEVFNIINQINEPEKPVVPQFVADWYEENKEDIEYNLYKLCIDFREQKLCAGLHGWFNDDNNKCIETLVMMHKFGYEFEHEQQYVVAIPDDGRNGFIQLWKSKEGKLLFNFADKIRYGKVHLLTEQEIKQKDERLWPFAKEVKE